MPLRLSHYDDAGEAHMVDVSEKAATRREAVAAAFVELSDEVLEALPRNPKGNPLEGGAVRGDSGGEADFEFDSDVSSAGVELCRCAGEGVEGGVAIEATAATVAGTGVEMEAMVAASIAALTVYDMTKALDKGIRIREVVLMRKSGGKSGEYCRGI